MKLLKDTFLFEYYDKGSNLRERMSVYSPVLDNLPKDLMFDDIRTIQKRYNYPIKNKVIDDLNKNRIVPILNKERIKIPTAIPAYLYNDRGNVVAIVNFSNYVSKTQDGLLHGDTRQIFACLQTGSILLGCFEKWNTITANQEVCKLGTLMYTKMFTKVLDKMFAVNIDSIKSDKVKFIAARFFVTTLLGKPFTDSTMNLCLSVCNSTTKATMMSFSDSLNEEAFTRLDKVIELIAENIDGCSALTIRTFLDSFMRMYGTSAIFALEYLPYFFHMVFSVAVGAHLNSEFVIEGLLGKDIDKLYNAVSNILRTSASPSRPMLAGYREGTNLTDDLLLIEDVELTEEEMEFLNL